MAAKRMSVTDAASLRALAHPLRLDILEQLMLHGPRTATQLGAMLGESASNCSWHLRKLAAHGLVEEVPDVRGRSRPWRAVSEGISWGETDEDEELYTDPVEAERFVRETGIDALAASIGTAHGVYQTREPKVDLQRLQAIRHLTDVHIVLHGGSGVPAYMIHNAIQIQGGGISKVNIATDLEVAVLAALNRSERMTNADCKALSEREFTPAAVAVRDLVAEKIASFLGSKDHASDYFDSSQWAVRP